MDIEAEVLPGLKPFALAELRTRLGDGLHLYPAADEDRLCFRFDADVRALLSLRTVAAIYRVVHFSIPRPLALLGHQHFTALITQIEQVRALYPHAAFGTFHISAAGRDSTVFRRLREEIAARTRLAYDPEQGDLLLRVRPALLHRSGWEVLLRLSPRPLSTRAWRVCDMPGALNAAVAAAMVTLTQPRPQDRFLNLMCGSGTLLIERLLAGPAALAVGCDTDAQALACASENLDAAGLGKLAEVRQMDAAHLDYPDGSFDALCVDLPWGQLVGEREELEGLYAAVLADAARVAVPGARLVIITHAVNLLEGLLPQAAHLWQVHSILRVFQGGAHPRIYTLVRL